VLGWGLANPLNHQSLLQFLFQSVDVVLELVVAFGLLGQVDSDP
jgi:hypothetical protein